MWRQILEDELEKLYCQSAETISLNFFMQVNVMLKELPAEEFGPGINFREYSFFDNSYMPQQVNASDLEQK